MAFYAFHDVLMCGAHCFLGTGPRTEHPARQVQPLPLHWMGAAGHIGTSLLHSGMDYLARVVVEKKQLERCPLRRVPPKRCRSAGEMRCQVQHTSLQARESRLACVWGGEGDRVRYVRDASCAVQHAQCCAVSMVTWFMHLCMRSAPPPRYPKRQFHTLYGSPLQHSVSAKAMPSASVPRHKLPTPPRGYQSALALRAIR